MRPSFVLIHISLQMRNIITALFAALIVLTGCGKRTGRDSDESEAVIIKNNIITVAENASVLKKIKTEVVRDSTYYPKFSTSGVVKAIPTLYAEIATPFSGRIIKSYVRLGQTISKGTPLFELSSPAFFETSKSYFEAKQEKEQALKSLKREQDLLANRVGVKKEVEEAQVNYNLKLQDFENAASALKVFQVIPENITLGEPLVVRAPISGKVVKDDLVIGQYVKEDAPSLLTIADLDQVWFVAHVKEKDMKLLDGLQTVDVRLSASPDEAIKGMVYHISEMLDEDTRAVEVIILCDNKEGRMKPFMYGTVQLTDTPRKALIIPSASILQEEDENYVIKVVEQNKFQRVPVGIESINENEVVVTHGLSTGDEIICEGAFYLLDAK